MRLSSQAMLITASNQGLIAAGLATPRLQIGWRSGGVADAAAEQHAVAVKVLLSGGLADL